MTSSHADTKNIASELEPIDTTEGLTEVVLPAGWRYKSLKLGSVGFPWYASPRGQLIMVGFVCFMCPGMFNALSGLGGGGQVDASAADKANVALYSTFAVVGTLSIAISIATGFADCLCQDFSQGVL